MKYIKLFEITEKSFSIVNLLKDYFIENYTINGDGTIDVDGDVNLAYKKLTKIPLKFGKISGSFTCGGNNLTSLSGSPYYVGGSFICSNNKLVDLKESPIEVGDTFNCIYNNLKTLDGMPLEIGRDFYCSHNKKLKSLKSMSNINGSIFCDNEIELSTFEGYCESIYVNVNKGFSQSYVKIK